MLSGNKLSLYKFFNTKYLRGKEEGSRELYPSYLNKFENSNFPTTTRVCRNFDF